MRDPRERAIQALHELPPTTTPRVLFARLDVSARVSSTILSRLRQEDPVVGTQRRISLASRGDTRGRSRSVPTGQPREPRDP